MNKAELIDHIADDTGHPKTQVERVLRSYEMAVIATLRQDQEVRLAGFGIFSRQDRPATTGRNPRTGEPVEIAAKRVCKFKPAAGLNAALAAHAG